MPPSSMRACRILSFHSGRNLARPRHLAVRHHHSDFPTEMLFVEAESLGAIAAVVEICVELHADLQISSHEDIADFDACDGLALTSHRGHLVASFRLDFEQRLFDRQSSAEANQLSVRTDHPMARHDDRQRILPVRRAYRA